MRRFSGCSNHELETRLQLHATSAANSTGRTMMSKLIRLLPGLLAVAAILAAPGMPTPSAQAPAPSPPDPLTLFSKMMPVFTHDRCTNCHGAVDPFTNRDHEGGQIEPEASCSRGNGCHQTADTAWKLATNSFVGMDARELCRFMAAIVIPAHPPEPDGFIRHLRDDVLIRLAFDGLAGGAKRPPPEKPPMTHGEFVAAAQAWLDDGLAACDREGFIIHTEAINTDHTYPVGPDIENRVKQSGRREVFIRFANGRYESRVQVKGSITLTQTMRAVIDGVPCTTTITSTTEYADVDDNPGAASPPPNLGITATARVDITFAPNGRYTVTVRLPEEKHRQIEAASLRAGCPTVAQPSPPETLEQTWSATSFVFRGTLPDPSDRTRLVGQEERTINARVSPDEDPWLHDHYAASVHVDNPSLHPVTVKTRWNIRYRP